MGEQAENMLDGLLCEICGELIDGKEPGYPRKCELCDGGLTKRERKRLRVEAASKDEVAFRELVARRGWTLTISNNAQHWTIRGGRKVIAEWWPSSGRLVIAKNFRRKHRAENTEQLVKSLKGVKV